MRGPRFETGGRRHTPPVPTPGFRSTDGHEDAGGVGAFETDLADGRRLRLGRVLEQIEQGVMAVDKGLDVVFANASALELLDGIDAFRRLPPTWHGLDVRRFTSSLFEPSAVSAEAVVDVGGRLIRLDGVPAAEDLAIVLVSEVSERVRREGAERDFVANAAHELLNPVAAILSAAEALELAIGDEEQLERFREHIVRESRRLDRLLRALLDLARVQHRGKAPELAAVPLRRFLDAIAAQLRPGPAVKVSVVCSRRLTVTTNEAMLGHAVANLATNAIRHTPAGEVRLGARALHGSVVVTVDDSGAGIAAGERSRVLERFYRPDDAGEGAGLGLAIARQSVEAVFGRLELVGSPLGGTRARIVLPEVAVP